MTVLPFSFFSRASSRQIWAHRCCLILLLALFQTPGYCATDDAASTEEATTPEGDLLEDVGKPLEGITVEAIENFALPKNNELGLSLGFFPFNAYYTGFALSGFYDYRMNKKFTWQIINLSYVFSSKTNLTSQLADSYKVNPQTIEKLQYMISTNFFLTHTRGKLLFLDSYVRSFSSSLIFGLGFLSTTNTSSAHGTLGLSFEAAVNDSIGWRFEFRDMFTVSGDNYACFALGTGYNF